MPRTGKSVSLNLWRERLTAPENVGRSAKELAQLFGVHVSTIQYWRHKLADARQPNAPAPQRSSNFVPVLVNPVNSTENVIVHLPGHVTISVPCSATSALVTVLGCLGSKAS